MATKTHQLIIGLIVRAMRNDGVEICNVDGVYPGMFGEKLPLPPQIVNHRPDILGVKGNGQICIGEAKTRNDIQVTRTETQLTDYLSVELNEMPCVIYLGVPQSAKNALRHLLVKLKASESEFFRVILIPDELIHES